MPSRWDEEQQKWVTVRKTKRPNPPGRVPADASSYYDKDQGKWVTIRKEKRAWYWRDLRKPKEPPTQQGQQGQQETGHEG